MLLAGRRPAVLAAMETVRAAGGICVELPFRRAHHTPLFADWSDLFPAVAATYQPSGVLSAPVYSCSTAAPIPADPDAQRASIARQWSRTVRFRESIEDLYQEGVRTFVEVGPNNKLCGFVDDILRGRPHLAVGLSSSVRGDLLQLLHLAGQLFAAGLPVDIGELDRLQAGITWEMRRNDDVRSYLARDCGVLAQPPRG